MEKAEFIRLLEGASIGASSENRAIVCTAKWQPFYFSIPTVKNLAIRCCGVGEEEAEKIAQAVRGKIRRQLAWQKAERIERESEGRITAAEYGIGDVNSELKDIRFTT